MSTTWEPDWVALTQAGQIRHKVTVQLVVNEYRRQQAAQGRVEVDRERLSTIRANIASLADWVMVNQAPDIEDELRSFIRALDTILSASTDHK